MSYMGFTGLPGDTGPFHRSQPVSPYAGLPSNDLSGQRMRDQRGTALAGHALHSPSIQPGLAHHLDFKQTPPDTFLSALGLDRATRTTLWHGLSDEARTAFVLQEAGLRQSEQKAELSGQQPLLSDRTRLAILALLNLSRLGIDNEARSPLFGGAFRSDFTQPPYAGPFGPEAARFSWGGQIVQQMRVQIPGTSDAQGLRSAGSLPAPPDLPPPVPPAPGRATTPPPQPAEPDLAPPAADTGMTLISRPDPSFRPPDIVRPALAERAASPPSLSAAERIADGLKERFGADRFGSGPFGSGPFGSVPFGSGRTQTGFTAFSVGKVTARYLDGDGQQLGSVIDLTI